MSADTVPEWCASRAPLLSHSELVTIFSGAKDCGDGDDEDGALRARIAALPMYLQTEALALRRHEQLSRQHIKELVELSECIVAVADGALRQSQSGDDHTGVRVEDDALRRMMTRAKELETCVRAAVANRVRCAQRMVLAATVAKTQNAEKSRAARKAVSGTAKKKR